MLNILIIKYHKYFIVMDESIKNDSAVFFINNLSL